MIRLKLRYMPLWSEDEVKKVNKYLPADEEKLSDEDLKEHFSWTGGVPRNIFLDWVKFKKAVEDSASKVPPSQLGNTNREAVLEEIPHCIIGAKVNIDADESIRYQEFECCFLSDKRMKAVVDYYASSPDELIKFILEHADINTRTGLLHTAFQEAVGRFFDKRTSVNLAPINSLASGIVNGRKVPAGRVFYRKWELQLPVPEKNICVGNNIAFIRPSRDVPQLWIPMSTSFPVVDLIYTLPQQDPGYIKSGSRNST